MSYRAVGRNAGVMTTSDHSFSFEILSNPRDIDTQPAPKSDLNWGDAFHQLGDLRIFPYGGDNRLPLTVRDIVKNNNEAPGILKRKAQLIWGQGPRLCSHTYADGSPITEWKDIKEVQKWLESWEFTAYLRKCNVDYAHMDSFFTVYVPAARIRTGQVFINKLEHITLSRGRLATDSPTFTYEPKYGIEGVRPFGSFQTLNEEYRVYPLFDKNNVPAERSMEYSSMYSFCQDVYAVPDIYGVLGWLRQSNNIPLLFESFLKNGISPKYHVTSPSSYWDKKREQLQTRYENDPIKKYEESMLDELKADILRSIGKVLSGVENVGKFWHTEVFYDKDGLDLKVMGWDIKPIEQNVKDFVEAYIKMSERAAYAISTGLNMNPSLANVDSNNRANSGSTQVYAHNNHMSTIPMDEEIICGPINNAIKINFPEVDCHLAFYHPVQKQQQEITPSKRNANLE